MLYIRVDDTHIIIIILPSTFHPSTLKNENTVLLFTVESIFLKVGNLTNATGIYRNQQNLNINKIDEIDIKYW